MLWDILNIILNIILQDPVVPQSDGENDYAYNWYMNIVYTSLLYES
jgi:hypothetical protein